jgi:spore coat protein CotF
MLSSSFPIQKLNNGFFQRFLFAFPESNFKQPINDIENDEMIYNQYKDFIQNYISTYSVYEVDGKIESRILKWTPEAKTFFYNWQAENCEIVNEYQNSIKGEIASKYDNHFIRLSLLLQLMFDPQSESIDITAVQGAKELCRYYMNCAFKVLAVIQNPVEYLETLNQNKKDFYKAIAENFTTAEAVAVGLRFDFLERRVKEFLKDTVLFKKVKHGTYEKTIKTERDNLK